MSKLAFHSSTNSASLCPVQPWGMPGRAPGGDGPALSHIFWPCLDPIGESVHRRLRTSSRTLSIFIRTHLSPFFPHTPNFLQPRTPHDHSIRPTLSLLEGRSSRPPCVLFFLIRQQYFQFISLQSSPPRNNAAR